MPSDEKLICVGKISRAHGVRGQVKIQTFTEYSDAISEFKVLYNRLGDKQFNIAIHGHVKDSLIASVNGISNRDEANKLGGTELYIYRSDLPDIEEDSEYYHEDLISMEVRYADSGRAFGKVVNVENFGAGDLIEILPAGGQRTEFYGFTERSFPEINTKEGYITIDIPETINHKVD